jgi:two-component system KDP operon response regulator KdpE
MIADFNSGELTVEFSRWQALAHGRRVRLSPIEYRILAYLVCNVGRVVTQNELLTNVWGAAYRDEPHLLRVNIARLRQKVEPEPSSPRYILTRPGIGYMLVKHEHSANS